MPVKVSALRNATEVAAWGRHSRPHAGGTVWSWGDNSAGQLGNATTTNSSVPAKVAGLTGVTNVAAGWYTTLAVKSDGTVWASG